MRIDITGARFGWLVAIEFRGIRKGRTTWFCRCDCGGSIVTTTQSLRAGKTRSCGCLHSATALLNGKGTIKPKICGTITAYTRGCRCEKCRASNAAYKAEYRLRKENRSES